MFPGLYERIGGFFINFLPESFSSVKAHFLRRSGARIGKNCYIDHDVWIRVPWKHLEIGDNVVISKGVVITTAGGIRIEENVVIGYGAKILTANHRIPPVPGRIRFSGHECSPITIRSDAWIGANSVVLPGATVGIGAVVGAGAVVTKDIPDYEIWGGVPAKAIRRRETE